MKGNTRAKKLGRLGQARYLGLCLTIIFCCGVGSSGCTRQFFRKRADEEVSDVLADKDRDPAWKIEQWHVYPDPRARFADPTDPDRPPKPPDDPASYDLAPNPQRPGKAGVARIEGNGYLDLLAVWDAENRLQATAVSEKLGAAAKEPPKAETNEPLANQKSSGYTEAAGSTTSLSTR